MANESVIPADAVDLETALKTIGALKANDAAEIVRQLAATLATLHSKSIVHRNIEPKNVLLTGGDAPNVLIIDFGLEVNLKDTPEPPEIGIGIPKYMAPEAFTSGVTPASDVFSLGAVFVALITGDVPSAQFEETLWKVEASKHLPLHLLSLLRRMLDPSPRNRPTAAEVTEALSEFTDDSDIKALHRALVLVLAPQRAQVEQPLRFLLDPGNASPDEIGELFYEISKLYRLAGGRGIQFTVADARQPVFTEEVR
jgi:serine/threonine protein kinase